MLDTKVTHHTPGPWTVEPGDGGDPSVGMAPTPTTVFVSVPNDDRFRVVEIAVIKDPIYGNSEEGDSLYWGGLEANARLIAAAPDLLQALQEIVGDCYQLDGDSDVPHCRFCDHSEGAKHDPDCVMQIINAAIAKAEGWS